MRLSESDIDDIRRHYPPGPEHWTVVRLAEWIGCSKKTIEWNASKLGLRNPPVEVLREPARKFYRENKESIRARYRERYATDQEFRDAHREYMRKWRMKEKMKLLQDC